MLKQRRSLLSSVVHSNHLHVKTSELREKTTVRATFADGWIVVNMFIKN